MSDDRRLLLAVVLCLGIYAGWSWIVMGGRRAQLAKQPPTSAQTAAGTPVVPGPAPAAPTASAPVAAPAAAAAPAMPAAAPTTVRLPEKLVSLDTPELHLVFSTRGGTLAHATLLKPQYRRQVDGKDLPVDLVRGPGPEARDLQIQFQGASWADDPLADYEASVEAGGRAVTFRRIVGPTAVTKRYETVSPYLLSLHVGVSGGTAQALTISYGAEQPPAAPAATGLLGHVLRSYPNVATSLCRVDAANKSGSSDKDASLTLPAGGSGTVQFGALDERFFVSAIAPRETGAGAAPSPARSPARSGPKSSFPCNRASRSSAASASSSGPRTSICCSTRASCLDSSTTPSSAARSDSASGPPCASRCCA